MSYSPKSGIYKPINISKYIGKELPHYRSGWELKAFISMDKNLNILKWGSQTIIIPYIDRTRGCSKHRYVVDLFFEIKDINNCLQKWLIQIKPYNQSVSPKITGRKSPEKIIAEQLVVEKNKCKWQAAIAFCKSKHWHFGVWTQRGITQMC